VTGANGRCFCGRMTNPPTNQVAPHSCADICSRKRYTCSHSCPLPCHPGPCPPCQVALVVPCPSHNYPLTVKCHMSSNKSTSMTPVCGTDCGRELSCGNMDHTCDSPCHYGPCRPCEVLETVRCYCGNHSKQEACGWNKEKELYSTRIIDGVEEHWKGRYNCGEPCDQFFDCGVHPCKEVSPTRVKQS
jgi:transcriptional repressor NF-X1